MSKYIKQKILDKTIDAAEIQKKELQWQQNSQAKASKDEEDTQHEQIVESNILSDNLLNAIALDANMTPNLQTFFYEGSASAKHRLPPYTHIHTHTHSHTHTHTHTSTLIPGSRNSSVRRALFAALPGHPL